MMSLPMKWTCSTCGSAMNSRSCVVASRAESSPALVEVVLQRGQVADRRVQPDIEVLARRVGDLDAEVGRVAADVPVASPPCRLVANHSLTLLATSGCSLPSCVHALRKSTQRGSDSLKKKCSELRSTGVAPVSVEYGLISSVGRVDAAAHLAVVAVLVLGVAVRALALDVAVRQEHVLDRVEELLDGACWRSGRWPCRSR